MSDSKVTLDDGSEAIVAQLIDLRPILGLNNPTGTPGLGAVIEVTLNSRIQGNYVGGVIQELPHVSFLLQGDPLVLF